MLAIHESSAGRTDRQGADFEGSLELLRELAVTTDYGPALPRLSAIVGKMLPHDASRLACVDERGRLVVNASTAIDDLGAVALTNLIAPVGRFVSPPAENIVAAATSPISSAAKSMNRHSRASDRTQAICLALAAWRANISRIIRSPEKRTIGFLGQAVKTP